MKNNGICIHALKLTLVANLFAFTFLLSNYALAAKVSLALVTNASQAETVNSTRTINSDAYISYGAALLIESWRLYTISSDDNYDDFPRLIYGTIFGTEWGLIYLNRKTGYGSYYTETAPWLVAPIVEKVYLGRLSLGAGIYLAKAAGKVTRQFSGAASELSYTDMNRRSFDFGGTLTLGYFFWNRQKLFFDGRYTRGFKDLSLASGSTYKYTDYQLLVGVRF